MQRISFLYWAMLATVWSGAAKAIPPPPEYEELTPQKMKQLGFGYQVWRKGQFSYIEVEFPQQVRGKLHPHSADAITHDVKGRLLQESRSWASPAYRRIVHRFNHEQVDLSISIGFCEPPAASCVDFGIKSVANFVRQNERDSPNHSNHP